MKYTLSIVAKATGLTPCALKQWFRRDGFDVIIGIGSREGRTWMRFTKQDVASISITKFLVDHGLTVIKANEIAKDFVKSRDFKPTIEHDLYLIVTRDGPTGYTSAAQITRWDLANVVDRCLGDFGSIVLRPKQIIEAAWSKL